MKYDIFEEIHIFFLKRSDHLNFLNGIIKNNGVIRIPNSKMNLFETLVKTIISQQISSKTANNIWMKIKKILREENVCLLDFLSSPKNYLHFQNVGISKQKYNYIKNIHEGFLTDNLSELDLLDLKFSKLKKQLIQYKGIGEWTCNMIGIFYLQEKNIWPRDDLIIKKISKLIEAKEGQKINFELMFKPYLSILALHFWKYSD